VIALIGDLGTGKTCFVKGLACGLGIDPATVTSPSFVLIHEYPGAPMPLYHIDLYRLDEEAAATELGLEEYFAGPAVCVVEWAERLEEELPEQALTVNFHWLGAEEREIRFSGDAECWESLWQLLEEAAR
jgi:tRNA threonylcarbamoyladenosine biosynthesis protein TsaE